MTHFFKALLGRPHRHTKSSQVGALLAWNQRGRPVWIPRDYASLTEEGYQKNVIAFRCVNVISRNMATPPLDSL